MGNNAVIGVQARILLNEISLKVSFSKYWNEDFFLSFGVKTVSNFRILDLRENHNILGPSGLK
jgi:hypothetical protein